MTHNRNSPENWAGSSHSTVSLGRRIKRPLYRPPPLEQLPWTTDSMASRPSSRPGWPCNKNSHRAKGIRRKRCDSSETRTLSRMRVTRKLRGRTSEWRGVKQRANQGRCGALDKIIKLQHFALFRFVCLRTSRQPLTSQKAFSKSAHDLDTIPSNNNAGHSASASSNRISSSRHKSTSLQHLDETDRASNARHLNGRYVRVVNSPLLFQILITSPIPFRIQSRGTFMTYLKVHRTMNWRLSSITTTTSRMEAPTRRRTTLLRFYPTAPWPAVAGSGRRSQEAASAAAPEPPPWIATESSPPTTRTINFYHRWRRHGMADDRPVSMRG